MRLEALRCIRRRILLGALLLGAAAAPLAVDPAQANPRGETVASPSGKKRPPSIKGFTPSIGAPGVTVALSGTNFTAVSTLAFNGTKASYTVNSSKKITATVPLGASSGPLTVTTSGGTAASTASFTVSAASTTDGTPAGIFVGPNGSDTSGDGTITKPFATLGRAQETMRQGGPQTTYIRGGYYALPAVTQNNVTYGLHLTSADSGQTWSYYLPDGYNSAILDGGSTDSSTGIEELITIDGASHVTINGLHLQHFRWTGIAVHGGTNTYFAQLFPAATATADSNTITNNIIHDGGYDTSPTLGTGGGGVYGDGNIPSTTVTNNVIYNISALGIAAFSGFTPPTGDVNSLRIANNVVFSVCLRLTDCGALYVHDENTTARNIVITNNYVRDTGTATAAARPIYLDDGVSAASVTGNIVTGIFKWAFDIHGGANNTIESNIADMTDGNEILLYQARSGMTAMTGNVFIGNVIISRGGGGWYEGGSTIGAQPEIRNNVYHQYAGAAVNTDGFSGLDGDSAPIYADPQLSCWTYNVESFSPIYNPPVSFVVIPQEWGPPGYSVPQTGTPPSQPHSC
jgi:Right handed beta helix region